MPVVTDEGYFENELQSILPKAQNGVIIPNESIDNNVVTPLEFEQRKNLEAIDYKELGGIEVGFQSVDWSKLNQPFGSIKSTSKEDTPVVAKTPSGITITEGDISEAINVGMGAGPGIMAGVKAMTLPRHAYDLAVTAEKQGFSPQEIFKSTGFFKGADGQWRFEIDDSGAKYFPENLKGGQKLLSDVLSHKELFEAYPILRNVKIKESPHLGGGAQYDQTTMVLEMGTNALKDKSILIHEIQHAVQGVEGMNKGGMPGKSAKDYNLKLEEDINRLRPEFLKLQTKEMSGGLLSDKQQARLDYLREVFRKYVEYSRAGDQRAREFYNNLAGEVEARNAQHRVDLTPSERMRFNPIDTEDVKRADQIVKNTPTLTTPYSVRHPYSGDIDFHTY